MKKDSGTLKMENSNFYDLKKELVLQGVKDCLQNSRMLLHAAETIVDTKSSYGAANSLAILAGEECVKGYILLAVYFNVQLDFKISPYFRDHSIKHQTGKELIDIINGVAIILAAVRSRKGKRANDILLSINEALFSKTNEEKWWTSANERKLKGFYVDFDNGLFHNPARISSAIVNESLRVVNKYIDVLSMVEDLKEDDYKLVRPSS